MRVQRHRRPRRATALIAAALATAAFPSSAAGQAAPGRQPDGSVILPTGQRITPAGSQIVTGSMPMSAELSPDGRFLAVLQAGYDTPSIAVIDVADGTLVSSADLPDAWLGLAFSASGDRLYAGGGARSSLWEIRFLDGELGAPREIDLPPPCADRCDALIGDLLFDRDGRLLYALDVLGDRAVIVNTQSGLVLGEIRTGAAPYRAELTPDGEHLLVSHWGEASLGLYRLADRRLVERIPVGEHPTDILVVPGSVQVPGTGLEGDEERTYAARLFAACAHADNLWTFAIGAGPRFDLLDVRSVAPFPGSPLGSMPAALSASADTRTLYVTLAGNNAVLAADISEALPELGGAIPTAWFPTATAALPDGGLAYLSGKGDGANAGLVSMLPPLSSEQMQFLSAAAVENLPSPHEAARPPPGGAEHVLLALTDADGPSWRRLSESSAYLPGYAQPGRGTLARLAWLTGGMETDFFAKLGPAVAGGRLSERTLAAAGRAARPAAGTLWSNAADAGISVETYGIGGGRPIEALLAKVDEEAGLARLTVLRLAGPPDAQDRLLGRLLAAYGRHPAHSRSVLFAVPVGNATGAAVGGGAVVREHPYRGFVAAPSILRTIEWLVGLHPMTQFDMAAPILDGLFPRP